MGTEKASTAYATRVYAAVGSSGTLGVHLFSVVCRCALFQLDHGTLLTARRGVVPAHPRVVLNTNPPTYLTTTILKSASCPSLRTEKAALWGCTVVTPFAVSSGTVRALPDH